MTNELTLREKVRAALYAFEASDGKVSVDGVVKTGEVFPVGSWMQKGDLLSRSI